MISFYLKSYIGSVNRMDCKDSEYDEDNTHGQDLEEENKLENSKVQKKKKTRFFESYISKVLKKLTQENGITANAKQQLNSAICVIAKYISKITGELTSISGKKTVSVKEISNAMSILFPPSLYITCYNEGMVCIEKFSDTEDKHSSRQTKAGIIFPPSICEKFLRNSKLMVTKTSPVFFACVLEVLCTTILRTSIVHAIENAHQRITIRDLELSVRENHVTSLLFQRCNMSFIGGGVLPGIHESLLSRKSRKRRKPEDSTKKHRFRPGTVCIREIKKYQKTSNCLTLPKFPFERIVRNMVSENIKISKGVFIVLQYYIEQFMVDFLRDANSATIHSGRIKLTQADINFISSLRKYKLKSNIESCETEEETI
jgi:histone H3